MFGPPTLLSEIRCKAQTGQKPETTLEPSTKTGPLKSPEIFNQNLTGVKTLDPFSKKTLSKPGTRILNRGLRAPFITLELRGFWSFAVEAFSGVGVFLCMHLGGVGAF